MPYRRKAVDELLLGLLYDAEELCFPELKVLDDEAFQVMDPEKAVDSGSYLTLIGINGMIDLESCREVNESISDNSEKESWSMAVNHTDKDLGPEVRAWSWFDSFTDSAIVKVDTGQNLRYAAQVLGSLL